MQDRRTRKTQAAIKKAFFRLMKEKPIEKITVLQICNEADIGRGTFYLHYHDIYDLYQQLENEVIAVIHNTIENLDLLLLNKIEIIIDFFYDNSDLLNAIISTNRWITFFRHHLQQEILSTYYDEIDPYNVTESYFIASGLSGVIEGTINNNINFSKDELIISVNAILNKFIAGYRLQPNAKI